MTDERLDELERRVRRLEKLIDGDGESPSANSRAGIDHRDAAVLDKIERSGAEPSPRQVLELYIQHTDISNRKTAKQRAKNLRKTNAYTVAVEK